MEARLAAMEQLVGKITTKVETLRKENDTLRVATNGQENDEGLSNNEYVESRNAWGEGEA